MEAHNYSLSIARILVWWYANQQMADTSSTSYAEFYHIRSIRKYLPHTGSPLPERPANLTLRHVSIIHRHGARTPKHVPPNLFSELEQNINVATNSLQQEELTKIGEEMCKSFGNWIRCQYFERDRFIPATYNQKLLTVRSTDKQRTRASAKFVIQGLYPTLPLEQIDSTIFSKTIDDENMFARPDLCPGLSNLYIDLYDNVLNNINETEKEKVLLACNRCNEWCGTNGFPVTKLTDLLMSLLAMDMDIKLDEDDVRSIMSTGSHIYYHVTNGDNDLEVNNQHFSNSHVQSLSLGIGSFVQELQSQLDALVNNSSNSSPLMNIYTGHDTTVLPLAQVLDVAEPFVNYWPAFVSNIVIELLQSADAEHYYVRLIASNGLLQHCKLVKYNDFTTSLAPYIKTDWSNECKVSNNVKPREQAFSW